MERCGQCKQFTRTRENTKDLCGAWEQPTSAKRQACEFFIPKGFSFFDKEANKSNPQSQLAVIIL
ncbi:hypothetical protein BCT94_12045 [Vibrio breoganii]|uniref:Uncharacterized protein n=2 Tax=Vibrio breoganii TaxID=553239 RepID=A0AAP8N1J8_9VIBR|nr:hypothetical protein [Vibrio breoganii]PMK51859.1 hypothetical protein BCT98_16090 [Vibrio breoganii]PMK73426.1 hypothetical protein BCT94_12045 [Vibrio breoganii]PMP17049.1 hypothetical protein BCS93_00180 [Vibrio breoganii]TKG21926.1 hypothetical protein FCV81_08380 [Vibrio breoganii]